MASLARWQRTIVDGAGNVLPNAAVEVRRESDNGLATLFSDRAGTIGISNPFNADAAGFAAFHVVGDAYKILATSGATSIMWRYVALGTLGEYDVEDASNILTTTPIAPQGRLTLTSGTSIMISDVASGATIYYTPAIGRWVPLWDAATSRFINVDFVAEVSQTLADATKSPAAAVANKNYDMLAWLDGSTPRCTRSAAWSTDTTRGTGAGTAEREFLQGIWVNKVDVTNGPAARKGTVVGSIRTNAGATCDMKFGTAAAGGGMATIGVSNAYNQCLMRCWVRDTTASWSYTSNAPRAANASNSNRINFISWLKDNALVAISRQYVQVSAAPQGGDSPANPVHGGQAGSGIGLDTTAAYQFLDSILVSSDSNSPPSSPFVIMQTQGSITPQEGFHFIQLIESSDGVSASTFVGNNDSIQGLELLIWA